MPTQLNLFVEKWSGCKRCPLHTERTSTVLGKGSVPCDVLFVGKGPGLSEDDAGLPFHGPDGKLLELIVTDALPEGVTRGYTNLVCCLPRYEGVIGDPSDEHIRACEVRLTEFVKLCDPRLVVMVGKVAAKYLDPKWKNGIKFHKVVAFVELPHPISILKESIVSQSLTRRRCVIRLRDAVEKFVTGEEVPA